MSERGGREGGAEGRRRRRGWSLGGLRGRGSGMEDDNKDGDGGGLVRRRTMAGSGVRGREDRTL